MTKPELLAVLDMSEEEQKQWLHDNFLNREYYYPSLADLAFRLRDEAVLLDNFPWACAEVYNYAHNYKLGPNEVPAPTTLMWIWFANQARPIHWIIAALIAKEKE